MSPSATSFRIPGSIVWLCLAPHTTKSLSMFHHDISTHAVPCFILCSTRSLHRGQPLHAARNISRVSNWSMDCTSIVIIPPLMVHTDLLSENVRMDIGLSSPLRILRVAYVTSCPVCRSLDAQHPISRLRQLGDRLLSASDGYIQ